MSKREELRLKRQRVARRQQLTVLAVVVGLAILITGYIAWQNSRPIEAIVTPAVASTYPQADGKALGSKEARVVLQEFADFQCPFCGRFASEIEPLLSKDYIETGLVRLEYKHLIVVDRNGSTESRRSAEASECMAEQNLFWPFYALMFNNQLGENAGAFRDARVKEIASKVAGLDTAKFNSCFDSGRYSQTVVQDEGLGRSLGVSSTPTLFLNQQLIANPLDYTTLKQLIDTALGQ